MSILPSPGYILCKPYIEEKTIFKSVKEQDGIDQKSEVLAVGDPVMDDHGTMRGTHVEKGDIIIHTWSNKEVEIETESYRFVHFTEVHGTYEPK